MDLVFAYLDPGSGSLIIQAVIAGIVAIPVLFRSRNSAAVRALRGRPAGPAAAPPADAPAPGAPTPDDPAR
ncbi:MAG: hypothetical protein ACKOTZ_11015 [Chloroflexota bacterium]